MFLRLVSYLIYRLMPVSFAKFSLADSSKATNNPKKKRKKMQQ
jgi:hypothetical protein